MRLINFDDFLARLFQILFSDRVVEFQFDFFAQFLRADPSGSLDYDFSRNRTRLHLDDYLHAVAFWRTEDANILDGAALVKRLHILFHGYVVIWLAHLCPHICQNPLFTDGGGPCVLYFDRPDDGTRRRLLRNLRPGRWRSQQRTNECDPSCRKWGAHPSGKFFHRLRSAIPRKRTNAEQAAISGRRSPSSRQRFSTVASASTESPAVSFNLEVRTSYSVAAAGSRHRERGIRSAQHLAEMLSRRCSPHFLPSLPSRNRLRHI